MPYVRRKYKRPLFRRRPKNSRYARKRLYKKLLKKTATHTYRRMMDWGTIPVNVDAHTALSFRLNMLPDYTEFTTLYDQYKIKKIVFRLERPFTDNGLQADATGGGGNSTTTNKYMRVVHDYDGGTGLSAEYQYLEYQNCKSYPTCGNKPIRLTLYPKILGNVFKSDSLSSTANYMIKPQWIDVAAPDVNHYGIRIFTPQIATGNTQVYRVFASVIFQCKNTR